MLLSKQFKRIRSHRIILYHRASAMLMQHGNTMGKHILYTVSLVKNTD